MQAFLSTLLSIVDCHSTGPGHCTKTGLLWPSHGCYAFWRCRLACRPLLPRSACWKSGADRGTINTGADVALGMDEPISIYGLTGILIAHVFFNMPLATRLLLAQLDRVPSEHWRNAGQLGLGSLDGVPADRVALHAQSPGSGQRPCFHAVRDQLHPGAAARRRAGGHHHRGGHLPGAALRFRSAAGGDPGADPDPSDGSFCCRCWC